MQSLSASPPTPAQRAGPEAPATDPSVLARLLDDDAPGALDRAGWPHRHQAVHGPVERLPATLRRLQQAGLAALFDRYRGPLSFGRGARSVQALDGGGHPAHLFEMGMTVHLRDLAPAWPGATALVARIEREFGVPRGSARLAAFASPRGDGLPAHFDGEDVISVQLIGTKRFVVAPVAGLPFPIGLQFGPGLPVDERLYAQCLEGFPAGLPDDATPVDMRPGSVLLLPRGTWHRTEALDDSLAVSIVLAPPVAADVLLAQLSPLLLQDARWRTPLYGVAGDRRSEVAALLDNLLADLPACVARLSAAALVRQADPGDAASIDDAARWQAVPTARLSVEERDGGGWLRVVARDAAGIDRTTLDRAVGAALVPLLRWLRDQRAAFAEGRLAERFASVPRTDRHRVLEGLRQAGFLARLRFVST